KVGMIADIFALKKSDKQRVVVPISCLTFYNGNNYVLVYHDDCNIEVREVTIQTKGNGIAYLESGLDENEKIITKNHLLILEALNNEPPPPSNAKIRSKDRCLLIKKP